MSNSKQLRHTYAYAFLAYCGITQLWVLYLAQQGLSLVQIGLCESIFHVASFLFEVPSGVLADRFTYKRMLTLSRIAALASAAMMLVHANFWWFALSFVVSAWSYNLQSGTLEALVYESLKDAGRADDYAQATSRVNAVIEMSATGGLLVAGTLTHGHLAAGYLVAIALAGLAMLVVTRLDEPSGHRQTAHPQTVAAIVKTATGALRHDRHLFFLMGFDALFSAVSSGYYYYFQNVMQTRHFASWMTTACLAGATVAALIAIRLAPVLLRVARSRLLVGIALSLGLVLSGAWLRTSLGLAVVYCLNYAVSALLPPVFNVYYNAAIPSAQRATLLSVASLLYSLAMIGLFPALGFAISRMGFVPTFGGIGVVLGVTLISHIIIHRWTLRKAQR